MFTIELEYNKYYLTLMVFTIFCRFILHIFNVVDLLLELLFFHRRGGKILGGVQACNMPFLMLRGGGGGGLEMSNQSAPGGETTF